MNTPPTYLQEGQRFSSDTIPTIIDQASLWGLRFGELLLDNLELRPNARILDVGCGTGFPLFELAQIYGPSSRVTGIDVWKEALGRARQKQAALRLPNVEIVEADAAQMPFEDASFDLAFSNLGVNNFERPFDVMAECLRVLKTGGSLEITTNVRGHMAEFYDVFRSVLTELSNADYLQRLVENEAHRGSRESVCELLREAGFAVKRVLESSFTMRYLDGSALLNHSLIRFGFLDAWRAVVSLEDEAPVFRTIEERLNDAASRRGGLTMTIPMLYVRGMKDQG